MLVGQSALTAVESSFSSFYVWESPSLIYACARIDRIRR